MVRFGNPADASDANASIRPSARDFELLGIQADESRLGVIRDAARQTAAPLIAASMDGQRPDIDDSLADTLAAAYRLIDPRGRTGISERVALLQNETQTVSVPVWWHPAESASPLPTDEALLEVVEQTSEERTAPPAKVADLATDDSHRLAISWIREVERKRQRLRRIVSVAGAALLVLAASVWLATRPGPPAALPDAAPPITSPAVEAAEISEMVRSARTDPLPRSSAPRGEKRPEPTAMEPPANELATAEALLPAAIASAHGSTVTPAAASPSEEQRAARLSEESSASETAAADTPATAEASNDSNQADATTTADNATPGQDETVAADEPRPEALITSVDSADVQSSSANVDAGAGAGTSNKPAKAPQPDSEALEDAMRSFANLTGNRGSGIDEVRLLELAEGSNAGSSDRFLLLSHAIDRAVMSGSIERAVDYLSRIEAEFDVTPATLQCECLARIAQQATSLTDRERVALWALFASDAALRSEEFDAAEEAARLGTVAAARTNDSALKLSLRYRRDAIALANRMSIRARNTIASGQPAASDRRAALQAGQYLCFYLLDWQSGLPWLAQGADNDLAEAARFDLAKVDRQAAGEKWLELAAAAKGREANALLVRARDCLQEASNVGGLAAAAIRKQLLQVEERLPLELRESQGEKLVEAPGPAPDAGSAGMIGQLTVPGSSRIIVVRYSPPQLLAAERWKAIVAGWPDGNGPTHIDLVGIVKLDRATTLAITSLPSGRLGISSVSIRGRAVSLDPDSGTAQIDVPAGAHPISWSVRMNQPVDCQLIVRDDRSGRALPLSVTPAMVERASSP